jgi:uncharacterized membrane protein
MTVSTAVVAPRESPSRSKMLKRMGWGLMALLTLALLVQGGRYLTLNPANYFPQQQAVYVANVAAITLHIAGAMLATLIGPIQFLPKITTRRFVRFHRWLGRTYLIGVLVGGLAGLYMATLAYGGFPARLAFGMLALLWLGTGFMAYRHIRAGRIQIHRQWMIRNYSLTFAAVTLRLWLIAFQIAGLDFVESYITVAWLCWVPNLLIAEVIVSRGRPQRAAQPTLSPSSAT